MRYLCMCNAITGKLTPAHDHRRNTHKGEGGREREKEGERMSWVVWLNKVCIKRCSPGSKKWREFQNVKLLPFLYMSSYIHFLYSNYAYMSQLLYSQVMPLPTSRRLYIIPHALCGEKPRKEL